jgi:hypothetical protein
MIGLPSPHFILSILQPILCCRRLQLVQTGAIRGYSGPDAKMDTELPSTPSSFKILASIILRMEVKAKTACATF